MKFSSKVFPILKLLAEPKNVDLEAGSIVRFDAKLYPTKRHYFPAYNQAFNLVKKNPSKKIDFVTEPVWKVFEGDPQMGNKLWELRNQVSSSAGVLLLGNKDFGVQLLYEITNDVENGEVKFFIMSFVHSVFQGFLNGFWLHKDYPEIKAVRQTQFDISFNDEDNWGIASSLQTVVNYLLFKEYAQPEIKFVHSKLNRDIIFNSKGYSNKEFPFKINIVDSHYFRTIIRTEGFGVKGHFRLQPYGEQRTQRKLVWINNFEKKGYVRIAKIEKIKQSYPPQ